MGLPAEAAQQRRVVGPAGFLPAPDRNLRAALAIEVEARNAAYGPEVEKSLGTGGGGAFAPRSRPQQLIEGAVQPALRGSFDKMVERDRSGQHHQEEQADEREGQVRGVVDEHQLERD